MSSSIQMCCTQSLHLQDSAAAHNQAAAGNSITRQQIDAKQTYVRKLKAKHAELEGLLQASYDVAESL